MLIKYAPDIDGSILDRLVATFAELRSLADQGEFIFEKKRHASQHCNPLPQKYP